MADRAYFIVRNRDGVFWPFTPASMKRDAVMSAEKSAGKSWRHLRRSWRLQVIKVTIEPVPTTSASDHPLPHQVDRGA